MHRPHDVILEAIDRRHNQQQLTLLRVYLGYCLVVAAVLLSSFHQPVLETRLGSLAPTLFHWLALGWGVTSALLLLTLPALARLAGQVLPLALLICDVLVVTLLACASAGIASGLGTLLLVTAATSAILLPEKPARGIAALATLAILGAESWLAVSSPSVRPDYFQAGVLGALYFAGVVVVGFLCRGLREQDIRALTQASVLADLERLNSQIIQRMRTGIAVVDHVGRVRVVNDAARELLNLDAGQTPGRLPEPVDGYLRDWRRNTALRPRPFQVTPAGAAIRASFSPVRQGAPEGEVTVFLEDTAELQQQAHQLKLAALGQLTATIAHEIRNPLSAISHAAQLLGESVALNAADRRLTEIIHRHCQRMDGVIEGVLATSRRTPPVPVRFALAEHLPRFAALFREIVPDALVELALTEPGIEVQMDRSHCEQVLVNLMTNAVRHSRARTGRPWVKLAAGIEPGSGRPHLDIVDEGNGVPAEFATRLFEPFRSTEPGGSGLGLYISRELCEANQARLDSLPQRGGACFRISFSHPDRVIT